MKKMFAIMLVLVVLLTGCSVGVSKEDYEALHAENQALTDELDAAKLNLEDANSEVEELRKDVSEKTEELKKVTSELGTLRKENSELEAEYESYKNEMSEYEGLAEAEAEARKIEAERVAAEEAEAEAKRAEEERLAAEEAAREAEEKAKLGYETGITYEQLARTPEDYKGEKVKFTGEILQVMELSDENQIRLSVEKDSWGYYTTDEVIYCGYDPSIINVRLLEDDIVTIYGTAIGLYSYTTVMGDEVTLPCVWIDKIELED